MFEVQNAFEGLPGVTETTLNSFENGILDFSLSISNEGDLRPDIYRIIRERNWLLLEFRRHTRALETIFRELTREGQR